MGWGKGKRYKGLVVGGRAERRSILSSDTHRMRAFLGYGGVVDHQHGIAATNELIRLNKQFCLHRSRIPDPGRNEVVQLIVFAKRKPIGTSETSRGDPAKSAYEGQSVVGRTSSEDRVCGAPPESHALLLRDEKNCSKGRNNKADLGNHAFVPRTDGAAVPHIDASVAVGIGVENLAPNSGEWNLDPVIPIHLGREIDHHQTALVRLASLAQPSENTALAVMHDQPLKSAALALAL